MKCATFPADARLRQSAQFRAVFKNGRRHVRSGLVVIVAPGGAPRARLGLAVAKRHLPRAVDRNRVKRVIRESFRATRTGLAEVDVVVLARQHTITMSNRKLAGQLHAIWQDVTAAAARHG